MARKGLGIQTVNVRRTQSIDPDIFGGLGQASGFFDVEKKSKKAKQVNKRVRKMTREQVAEIVSRKAGEIASRVRRRKRAEIVAARKSTRDEALPKKMRAKLRRTVKWMKKQSGSTFFDPNIPSQVKTRQPDFFAPRLQPGGEFAKEPKTIKDSPEDFIAPPMQPPPITPGLKTLKVEGEGVPMPREEDVVSQVDVFADEADVPNMFDEAAGFLTEKSPFPESISHVPEDEASAASLSVNNIATGPEGTKPKDQIHPRQEPDMTSKGLPRKVVPIVEDVGEQAVQQDIDRSIYPSMLIEKEEIGLPYRAGEGQRYQEDVAAMTPQGKGRPVDSSVVNLGMGAYVPLTEPVIIKLMNDIAAREAELAAVSPAALKAVQAQYSAQRDMIVKDLDLIKFSPGYEITATTRIMQNLSAYRKSVGHAIGVARDAIKKVEERQKLAAMQKPSLVTQVLAPSYSPWLIGGGIAVVGGAIYLLAKKK